MCIEANLEAHVYDLYIPTHLGLEEYTNYSRHYGIISLGLGFLSLLSPSQPPSRSPPPPAPSLPLSSFPPPLLRARGMLRRACLAPPPPPGTTPPLLQPRCVPWEARGRPTPRLRWPQPPAQALPARASHLLLLLAQIPPCTPLPPPPPLRARARARAQGVRGELRPPPLLPSAPLLSRTPPLLALARGARVQGARRGLQIGRASCRERVLVTV